MRRAPNRLPATMRVIRRWWSGPRRVGTPRCHQRVYAARRPRAWPGCLRGVRVRARAWPAPPRCGCGGRPR
jgi:hypothetical protein